MYIGNIQWHISGFLNDASYTFELKNLLEKYNDSFLGAESLVLNLNEIKVGTKSSKESRVFSEDGKEVEINIDEGEVEIKGKFLEPPSARSVYKTIIFVLDKADEEYADKFLED